MHGVTPEVSHNKIIMTFQAGQNSLEDMLNFEDLDHSVCVLAFYTWKHRPCFS